MSMVSPPATAIHPSVLFVKNFSKSTGKGDDPELLLNIEELPKFLTEGTIGEVPAYVLIPQLPSNKRDWVSIVRALKASQALGKAALTGRGEIPARLCCQPPNESLFLHNVQAGAHILLYADRKGE